MINTIYYTTLEHYLLMLITLFINDNRKEEG